MRLVFYIFLLFFATSIYGQDVNMEEAELELERLLLDLRSAENDQDKKTKNDLLRIEMEKVLLNEEAMTYPFSKLSTIGFIDSPDKQMRIVNWNIEQDNLSQNYTCFVIHYDKKKKEQFVTELIDVSFGMPTQPTEILTSDNWYGALYYKIIPVKKGARTLYTVIGWDYYTEMSQVKLIDVIYFSGVNVKIGSPIFKVGKETKKRVFYEHSKKAVMYLNYEEDRERIMMDHLSPESPSMKKFREFYIPDLSYDAFIYDKKKWVLKEDVIGVNPEPDVEKQYVYVKNERTGKVERKEIKVKWENPEDPNAPAGGSEHVAVTPESVDEEEMKRQAELDARSKKKDKRDPSNLSTVNGTKKKKRKLLRLMVLKLQHLYELEIFLQTLVSLLKRNELS